MFWPLRKAGLSELTLLWSGRDPNFFRAIVRALEEMGIPLDKTRARGFETLPPSLHPSTFFSRPVFAIRVRLGDEARAREIVREVLAGAPPA
ncbi:MAG: hypothetical protein WAR21_14185 [Candidatus Acidiferrales bacterium]